MLFLGEGTWEHVRGGMQGARLGTARVLASLGRFLLLLYARHLRLSDSDAMHTILAIISTLRQDTQNLLKVDCVRLTILAENGEDRDVTPLARYCKDSFGSSVKETWQCYRCINMR